MKESRSLKVIKTGGIATSDSSLASRTFSRECFKYDRAQVAEQIKSMRAVAYANALELELIAAEKVFENVVCEEFLLVAKEFNALAGKLTSLNGLVKQAKDPSEKENVRIRGVIHKASVPETSLRSRAPRSSVF
jgi:hypothetical protein